VVYKFFAGVHLIVQELEFFVAHCEVVEQKGGITVVEIVVFQEKFL